MSQNARQRLSPLLKYFVSFSSLTPIIVEASPDQLNNLVNIFDSFGLEVTQVIPTFGFIAGLASVPLIKTFALLPEVRMIHPDREVFAFSAPFPFNLNLDVNPLEKIPTPLNIAGNLIDNMGNTIFSKSFGLFFDKKGGPILERTLDFFDPLISPLALPNPLTLVDNMPNPLALVDNFGTQLNQFNPLSILQDTLPSALTPQNNLLTMPSTKSDLVSQSQNTQKSFFSTVEIRELLGINQAEELGITGKGVKVAILDTGIDINHPQVSPATDFDNAIVGHPPLDENGHGTFCATEAYGLGTINPRGISIKGIAIDAIPIAIKVLGGGIGTGRNSDVLKGIEMAFLKGANIISMSLGSEADQNAAQDPSLTDPTSRVIKALTEKGVIFTIAAGNSGPDAQSVGLPGGVEEAITVGAVDPRNDQVTSFSSRGPFYGRIKPDILSYGQDIYSGLSLGSLLDTATGDRLADGYSYISGTSMATPMLGGMLALVKQAYPETTTSMIKRIFKAKGIPKNSDMGFGIARWSWFN